MIADALKFLQTRGKAYRLAFQVAQPADRIVLEDLAKFCRANESCAVPGDRDKTLLLEGRREVWLRIQQHLNLEPQELFDLYRGNSAAKQETKV